LRPRELPRPWQLALDVASVPVEVGTRNRRGRGYRILGLRQVDARTGGPVSIRSAFVSAAVKKTWSRSIRVLVRQLNREHDNRAATIDAELEQARDAHAGDPEAMRRAAAEVYRRHGLNPMRACLPALASATLLVLPALWSPLNQTLPERIAGTIVIRQD
jgi:hypothetical protein